MKKRLKSGFSLIEVTLAIGIAAFCLIAVFGLVPVAVLANRNATSQTAATNIAAAVIADLRATPANAPSPQFIITIPTDPTAPPLFNPPDIAPCSNGQTSNTSQIRYIDTQGQSTNSIAANSRYRLIVTFVRNTTATSTTGATYANVKVAWPPAIDPCAIRSSGSVDAFVALDTH